MKAECSVRSVVMSGRFEADPTSVLAFSVLGVNITSPEFTKESLRVLIYKESSFKMLLKRAQLGN